MYFTYEESEIFNSLFEDKQTLLIDRTDTKNSIVEFLTEAIDNCDDPDLIESLAGALKKIKALDDYTIAYLADNAPISPDTKLS